MVRAGDTLHNPLSGETFRIRKTAADTDGALFVLETCVPAGGGTHVPPHLHPAHTMGVTMLTGAMRLWAGRSANARVYTAGDVMSIPPRTAYNWTVTGPEALRFVTEFEPAGEWELLFESMCAIGQAAAAKKLNPLLASMSVLNRRRDHLYFAGPPIRVQQALFAGVAALARRWGYLDYYPYSRGA
jgi:quercetin dioxygenase-like cupin family protein